MLSSAKGKAMVQSIIAQLLRLVAQKVILAAFGIDIGAGVKTGAKGMVIDPLGNVTRFARGAVLTSPIMFPLARGRTGLAGEAGPEAVFPLTRTSSGDLAVKGEAPVVNVNVVNNHPDATVQVQKTDDGSRIDIIIDRTRRALANDVRTGGTVFSSAMEFTYALGRARS